MPDTLDETPPVVVGVDDSLSAHDAAMWAADLAVLRKVPLRLVYVVNQAGSVLSGNEPGWLLELADSSRQLGARSVRTEVRYGGVGEQLLAAGADSGLLVLGSYGDEGWSGMLVGTNALRLIEGCRCPVVVVRGRAPGLTPPRGGPLVVGMDGTPSSQDALRFAARLAAASGHRRLVAVHAWSDVRVDRDGGLHRIATGADQVSRAEQQLEEWLAPVLEDNPGLVIERDVREDTPLRALLDRAADAWLVVVGQRRGATPSGIRGGSTSHGLVEFAPCPIAVIAPAPARV
jgi:nucleotide-binding universal stress UspA family protein